MLGIRADIVGHNNSQCLNVHIRRNVITSSLLATKTLPGPKLYTQTSFFYHARLCIARTMLQSQDVCTT